MHGNEYYILQDLLLDHAFDMWLGVYLLLIHSFSYISTSQPAVTR